jgi:predicted MFS family arabinose efflux permease
MFFTSWVSSRLGARKGLLIGLALVVAFATACSLAPSVAPIIGFRAGWGVGNALFVSTALAEMVTAATGGSAAAIILYETSLGIGFAIGPLAGGLLGSISWRGPFIGTATLMAVGFAAVAIMLKPSTAGAEERRPVPLSAPFKALADPRMRTISVAAFFYNMAFFTILAYPPFALAQLGISAPLTIGLVFFGWGALLAIAAVLVAPRLTMVMRRTSVLVAAEILLALVLIAMALLANSAIGIMVCAILAGFPLGLLNTVLTETSMEASDLPRPVASSTYSGCRFLGGAVAPPLCTFLAGATAAWVPFVYGATMILLSAGIILTRRANLARADGLDAAMD